VADDFCKCGKETVYVAHAISGTEEQYWLDFSFCEDCYNRQTFSIERPLEVKEINA
jgi:hypothetical protein